MRIWPKKSLKPLALSFPTNVVAISVAAALLYIATYTIEPHVRQLPSVAYWIFSVTATMAALCVLFLIYGAPVFGVVLFCSEVNWTGSLCCFVGAAIAYGSSTRHTPSGEIVLFPGGAHREIARSMPA